MTEQKYKTYRGLIGGLSFIIATILSKRLFSDGLENKTVLDSLMIVVIVVGTTQLYDFLIRKMYPDFIEKFKRPHSDERAEYIKGRTSTKILNLIVWGSLIAVYASGINGQKSVSLWISGSMLFVIFIYYIIYKYYERTT